MRKEKARPPLPLLDIEVLCIACLLSTAPCFALLLGLLGPPDSKYLELIRMAVVAVPDDYYNPNGAVPLEETNFE